MLACNLLMIGARADCGGLHELPCHTPGARVMRASGAPLADPPANSGGHPRPGPADGPGERSAVAGRPIILLYNSAWGRWPDGSCATADCEFTTDRSRLPEAQAVVFHVPTLTAVER